MFLKNKQTTGKAGGFNYSMEFVRFFRNKLF